MLFRLLALAGALVFACVAPATAQGYKVVASCGAQSLRVGDGSGAFLDPTGNLCTTSNLGALNGASTASNQASEIAALTAANQRSSFVTDAAGVAVAASGTFSGTLRDAGASPSPYTKCSANLFSTQGGSLALYISDDGTNFTQAGAVTVSANVPQTISVPVVARYCKFTLFNGAAAATVSAHTALSVN